MRRKENEWINHEIKEVTFYVIFGLIMTIVLPIFFGFGLKAFEESFVSGRALKFGDFLVTYIIYYIMIIAGLIGLSVLKIREMFITDKNEHPANQKDPSIFSVAVGHDPEQDGLLYNLFDYLGAKKNPMRWSLSIFRCFIIAILVFGSLGLFQAITNTAFVGIPQMPFQVTKVAEVYFTAEPPAFAETMLLLFVMSIFLGFNAWFCSKLKLGKGGYFLIGILICILIGFLWMGFHSIVYGNNEAKLTATFLFGFVGSLITLVLGTWIFFYTWHFMNNLFVKLNQLFLGNEDLVFITAIILVAILILWVLGELILYKFKKKRRMNKLLEQVPE